MHKPAQLGVCYELHFPIGKTVTYSLRAWGPISNCLWCCFSVQRYYIGFIVEQDEEPRRPVYQLDLVSSGRVEFHRDNSCPTRSTRSILEARFRNPERFMPHSTPDMDEEYLSYETALSEPIVKGREAAAPPLTIYEFAAPTVIKSINHVTNTMIEIDPNVNVRKPQPLFTSFHKISSNTWSKMESILAHPRCFLVNQTCGDSPNRLTIKKGSQQSQTE